MLFLATAQPAPTVSHRGLHCVSISVLIHCRPTPGSLAATTHLLPPAVFWRIPPPPNFLSPLIRNMCSRVWFVTDRRISQEYPQLQILRALKERCADEDVEFRSLLMDQIVLTISEGQLGKYKTITQSSRCLIVWCVKWPMQWNLDYSGWIVNSRWSLFGGAALP